MVTHDLSRIGRSQIDLLTFMQEMADKRVRVVFVKDGIDAATETGKLLLGVLSSVVQFERGRLSERTKAGVAAAREKNPAWGMGRRPKHLRPEPHNKIASDAKLERLMARIDMMEPGERGEYIRRKAESWGMKESGLRGRILRVKKQLIGQTPDL